MTEKELKQKVADLEEKNVQLNRLATDRLYMLNAARNMLGPNGRKVFENWDAQGVKRFHCDWGPAAVELTGEERAAELLAIEAAPKQIITNIDT